MIAVIFEVWPAEGRTDEYMQVAAELKVQLEQVEGFISIERFSSLEDEGKILSLSFWQDEEAVYRWRNMAQHRLAQAKGRERVFADYRLRVASVIRDYGKEQREQAPDDSRHVHG